MRTDSVRTHLNKIEFFDQQKLNNTTIQSGF